MIIFLKFSQNLKIAMEVKIKLYIKGGIRYDYILEMFTKPENCNGS